MNQQYLFSDRSSHEVLEGKRNSIRREISGWNEINFPATDEDFSRVVDAQVQANAFTLIEIQWENPKKEISMENLPVDFAAGEMSISGRKNVAVVKYTLQHNQHDSTLFAISPQHFNTNVPIAEVRYRAIIICIQTQYSNENLPDHIVEQVFREKTNALSNLKQYVEWLNADLSIFNSELPALIRAELEKRKTSLALKKGLMDRL